MDAGSEDLTISLTPEAWDKVLEVMGEVPAKDLFNARILLEIHRQGQAALAARTVEAGAKPRVEASDVDEDGDALLLEDEWSAPK